jgi:hypothetical protein
MDRNKFLLRVAVVCLVLSMLSHWIDIKTGFVDGFNSVSEK